MSSQEEKETKLLPFAVRSFPYYEDMYKIIDFLNKNIKEHGIILGLTKEKNDMVIKVYKIGS